MSTTTPPAQDTGTAAPIDSPQPMFNSFEHVLYTVCCLTPETPAVKALLREEITDLMDFFDLYESTENFIETLKYPVSPKDESEEMIYLEPLTRVQRLPLIHLVAFHKYVIQEELWEEDSDWQEITHELFHEFCNKAFHSAARQGRSDRATSIRGSCSMVQSPVFDSPTQSNPVIPPIPGFATTGAPPSPVPSANPTAIFPPGPPSLVATSQAAPTPIHPGWPTSVAPMNQSGTIPNPPVPTAPTPSTPSMIKHYDPVRDFKRGIKRDPNLFPVFKDETKWDSWSRTILAQAQAQDVHYVLDPKNTPQNQNSAEYALFMEHQKYMYAVFERTLQTDKGKALVRQYADKSDAQSIFVELKEYSLHSTKASLTSTRILEYVTSIKIGDGGKWDHQSHAFILHWEEQLCIYHSITGKHCFTEKVKMVMLQTAVHGIPELRAVKIQADQYQVQNGKDLDFE